MHLHLFDIDGTLTRFYHTEEDSFNRMLRDLLDLPDDYYYQKEITNYTDSAALDLTYQRCVGRPPTPEEITAAQRLYMDLLEKEKNENNQPFRSIPGAKAYIDYILNQPNRIAAVATGNWECVARFKLEQINVDPNNLEIIGADAHFAKSDFVNALVKRVKEVHQLSEFTSATYYGDSIYDHRAALGNALSFKGIDFRGTGVLTGAGIQPVFKDFNALMAQATFLRD